MDWIMGGILYSLFNSIVIFINQHFKMNPYLLGAWRGIGSALIALPLIPVVQEPPGILFFALAVLQGFMVGFYDFKLFSASARYGAGSTALITVFAIVISIFSWWALDITRLRELWNDPRDFISILVSLACCITGYLLLIGSKLTKDLFRFMWPAVIVLACMTINTKYIYRDISFETGVVYYMFMIGAVGGISNLIGFLFQKDKSAQEDKVFDRRNIMGGLSIVISSIGLMGSKGFAMMTIPNPGYLNLLALTSPLWILIINRLFRIESNINIPLMLFVLASIGALVYFSNLPLQMMPY